VSETKRDNSPGPGAYLHEETISSFRRQKSPNKFQFFQSGVERFQKTCKNEKSIPPEIGIIFYDHDHKQINKNVKKRNL